MADSNRYKIAAKDAALNKLHTFDSRPESYGSREWYEHQLGTKSYLLAEIDVALAWGMPDRESTGVSTAQLLALLSRAKDRIEELEQPNNLEGETA